MNENIDKYLHSINRYTKIKGCLVLGLVTMSMVLYLSGVVYCLDYINSEVYEYFKVHK